MYTYHLPKHQNLVQDEIERLLNIKMAEIREDNPAAKMTYHIFIQVILTQYLK